MCCPTEIIFTYLFVYVYDNISKDSNYKFQKSQIRFLSAARVWEWRGIGTDCSIMAVGIFSTTYKKCP